MINRLEKHFLTAASVLTQPELELRKKLDDWCTEFLKANQSENIKLQLNELFIGLHDDSTSSIVLLLSQHVNETTNELNTFHQNTQYTHNIDITENTDLIDTSGSTDNTKNGVYLLNQAKQILIKCATPDSIIRYYYSNSKINENDKKYLWKSYFEEQKHLNLNELINYHLTNCQNNLLQLTTFSKFKLTSSDTEKFSVTEICLLKTFDTQSQFELKIEQFLIKFSTSAILLIQADLNQNDDLIACARHTIVEKFKEINKLDYNTRLPYIVLLINLPREYSKRFIGLQICYWSCYHLDEIENESNVIPEFKYFKNKSLSELIEPDETNMDPKLILNHLTHQACSLIKDTNLERTIKRIEVFTKLCSKNKEFAVVILHRLVYLLNMKESEYGAGLASKWLFREAVNLNSIKNYSSFRHACFNYFESKLCPLLAYLLSFLDKYSNLDIILTHSNDWTSTLWLDLLKNTDICYLNYSDMRVDNKEMKEFECQSDWIIKSSQEINDENKRFKPKFPFFWIFIDQMNKLYDNFINDNNLNNVCKEV